MANLHQPLAPSGSKLMLRQHGLASNALNPAQSPYPSLHLKNKKNISKSEAKRGGRAHGGKMTGVLHTFLNNNH